MLALLPSSTTQVLLVPFVTVSSHSASCVGHIVFSLATMASPFQHDWAYVTLGPCAKLGAESRARIAAMMKPLMSFSSQHGPPEHWQSRMRWTGHGMSAPSGACEQASGVGLSPGCTVTVCATPVVRSRTVAVMSILRSKGLA